MELTDLLKEFSDRKATDLHLVAGVPPMLRIEGCLQPTGVTEDSGVAALDPADIERLLAPYLTEDQLSALMGRVDVNITMHNEGITFRGHVFRERGYLSTTIRHIPASIPSISDCYTPDIEKVLRSFVTLPRGLVLSVGPMGSGKTTLCATLIETINKEHGKRITTIEDPISFVFTSKKSAITQREVGQDVDSIEQGALSALNSDLDVAFIGELRNSESVRIALAMAETGHLVFSQLHAESASEAIQRLLESFPEPRDTIRQMLARNLVAVINQRLLRRSDRKGRAPVNEILIVNSRIRKMILEGQVDLSVAVEAGREEGMQTMDDSILKLFKTGRISHETAEGVIQDKLRLGSAPEL